MHVLQVKMLHKNVMANLCQKLCSAVDTKMWLFKIYMGELLVVPVETYKTEDNRNT